MFDYQYWLPDVTPNQDALNALKFDLRAYKNDAGKSIRSKTTGSSRYWEQFVLLLLLGLKKYLHNRSFSLYTWASSCFWPRERKREVTCVDPFDQTYENSQISSRCTPNKLVHNLDPEYMQRSYHSNTQSSGKINLITQSQLVVFSERGLQWVQLYIIMLNPSWSECIME